MNFASGTSPSFSPTDASIPDRVSHSLSVALSRRFLRTHFYLSNPLDRLAAFLRLFLRIVKRVGGRELRSADAHLRLLSSDLFSTSIVVWYFVDRASVPSAHAKRGVISFSFSSR